MLNAPSSHAIHVRRLSEADAPAYRALRLQGFAANPGEFRYAVEDEVALSLDEHATRLRLEFVVGVFVGDELSALGGLTRYAGMKLRHRALLWGMYVTAAQRGRGLGDAVLEALLAEGRRQGLESVVLSPTR